MADGTNDRFLDRIHIGGLETDELLNRGLRVGSSFAWTPHTGRVSRLGPRTPLVGIADAVRRLRSGAEAPGIADQ